jgi:hypothetical protein
MTRVDEEGAPYAVGTILQGATRRHRGRIEILGASARKYRIRTLNSHRDTRLERYLERPIVEHHYRVVQTPKGAAT